MITLKLSTKTNGILYKDLSVENVIELTRANVGLNGPRRIIIEWTVDDGELALAKPQEVSCEPPMTQLDDSIPISAPEKNKTQSKLSEMSPASKDDSKDLVVLAEIGRINKYDFTTTKFIPLEANLSYAETDNGRISIKYAGTKINTTWEEMVKLEQFVGNPIPRGVKMLEGKDVGNRRTAVTKFINKMRENDVKAGDGVKLFNKIFKDMPKSGTVEPNDPDADFRSTGVGTSVYPPASPKGQDFGKG